MANAYQSRLAGGSAATGNATVGDVLATKTFSSADGVGLVGTMVNNGAVSQTLAAGQSYTIPEGYHNGSGTVTADEGIVPDDSYILNYGTSSGADTTKGTFTTTITMPSGCVGGEILINVHGKSTVSCNATIRYALFNDYSDFGYSTVASQNQQVDISNYDYIIVGVGPTTVFTFT